MRELLERARPADRPRAWPSCSSSCCGITGEEQSIVIGDGHRLGLRPRRPRPGAHLQVERRVQLRPGRVRHASRCARCTSSTRTACRTAWPSSARCWRRCCSGSSPSGSSSARCSRRRGSSCSSPRLASPCWRSPSSSGCSTTRAGRSPRAFPTLDRVTILDVQISDQRLWLIGTLAVLAVVLGLVLHQTNLGLAIIGASQEPTATELVGISVRRLSTFMWVLAALLGALAAVIAVPDTGSFTPGVMTSAYLIPAFTAAVLGGMTSLPGAFLGGVLVGIIQSVATNADVFQDIPGTPSTLSCSSCCSVCSWSARRVCSGSRHDQRRGMPIAPTAADARRCAAAVPPVRRGVAGPRRRVGGRRLPRAGPAAQPVGHRPAAVRHRRLLRDRRPVAERAARLRRSDLPRPRRVRRHRCVHVGLPGHRAGPVVLGRRPRRHGDRRPARRSSSAACRCASAASTSP